LLSLLADIFLLYLPWIFIGCFCLLGLPGAAAVPVWSWSAAAVCAVVGVVQRVGYCLRNA
jgi:hypothetical protein